MTNAIVICADTFRADHLGCYGASWIKTPHLDQLAAEGIVFEDCFAEALPSIPAHKAYFTGRPLFPHWERRPYKGDRLSYQPGWHPLHEHEVTVPEILNPLGFVTGLVADTYHLFKPGMNLARGCSYWQVVRGQEADPYRTGPRAALDALAARYTGLDGANMHRSSLPRDGGTRHYLLNNQDRRGDEDYLVDRVMRTAASWLDDNAGEVTLVDHWIGHLLDRLQSLGLADETAVFFTSDHGTILGEHGRLHKSPETLIAPETRLPLLVRLPATFAGGRHAGTHVRGFMQSYDLLPTVMEVLGVAPPPYVLGRSALPLLQGSQPREYVVTAFNDHASLRTQE